MGKELNHNPKAKALIFDIDGTICDTMPAHYNAWRETCAEVGIDFTVELFAEVTGIPAYQTSVYLKEKFNGTFDPAELTEIKEERFDANILKSEPIEPVVNLIRANKGKIPMACGTGGTQYFAWKTLEIAGVGDCFEHVVSAEYVENHKPHPDTFLRAAELLGVAPAECEVFEDGKLGIEAARRAGMMVTDVTEYYEVKIGQ